MDIDHWIKILEVIVSLVQAIIWPLIALFVLVYLGKTVKAYVDSLGKDKNVSEVGVEAGTTGFKFNVKREVEIATNLTLAMKKDASTNTSTDEQTPSEAKTQNALDIASQAASSQTVQRIAGKKVLWVDDHPDNNIYPRRALEALGIQFDISTSTDNALTKIKASNYDAIISDMGRGNDGQAGFTLLEKLKAELNGQMPPFIIYAAKQSNEDTIKRGGFGSTNKAQELFQIVINALMK